MKTWRLTKAAEASLAEIAEYSAREFGEARASAYCEALLARLDAIAAGAPPHPRDCSVLMAGVSTAAGLSYFREGGHFIILRIKDDRIDVLEFLHERSNLPFHIGRLSPK